MVMGRALSRMFGNRNKRNTSSGAQSEFSNVNGMQVPMCVYHRATLVGNCI